VTGDVPGAGRPVSAGGALDPIDWAGRWRALVAGRNSQRTPRRDGGDAWAGRAGRFADYSRRLPPDDPLLARLRAVVRPDDTILDIGAGTGRYALPLARLVRRVVAVEPSPAMRGHLAARIAEEGAGNVDIVAAAWPAAAVAPAAVVLCAHVLYGVAEIVPFLRALDGHTGRACFVAIQVGQHPGLVDLHRAVFGEERVPQPAFMDLYNMLASIGIIADVQIVRSEGFRWADPAEAVAHYRDRLKIAPDGPDDERLRAALAARLERRGDGRWHWSGPPAQTALVSWTK